jgi:hypothetical protein
MIQLNTKQSIRKTIEYDVKGNIIYNAKIEFSDHVLCNICANIENDVWANIRNNFTINVYKNLVTHTKQI